MQTQVISPTVQKFNGESFYLCGQYFQHKGKRLHRTVWEYHNGEIPQGYHVHHKDGDRSNNSIDNLELLQARTHLSKHMLTPERIERSRKSISKAIEKAPEWHHSDAGKQWHSEHAKEYWANAPMNKYTCTFCGKVFESRSVSYKGNHFCCTNHKAAYRRQRIKNGEIEK